MGEIGVRSYGVHIPKYRLNRKVITAAMGWIGGGGLPGEKAVANHDEDSITMAVAATRSCLKAKPGKVDAVVFATTTAPYREKESSPIIAAALNLGEDIRTSDITDSLKAGTSGFLSAAALVESGKVQNVVFSSADCRLGKPAGSVEGISGDAAAAFLLGSQDVIAALTGSYSLTNDFPDYRRAEDDRFVRAGEDRFIREEGYLKFIGQSVAALLKKYSLEPKDIAKVAFPCLNVKEHANIGKKMGFQPTQIQEPLLAAVGEAGAASPMLLLAAMLDEAKSGDKIIVSSYGNGSESLLFNVTPEIEKYKQRGVVKAALANRKDLTSYERFLAFRNILPVETNYPAEVAPTQLHLTWRERKTIMGFFGTKCKKCSTPQFPPQRVCVNPACGKIDEMEPYRFADITGKIFTYTADYTSPCLDAPLLFALIDFDGGGRFVIELTDTDFDSIKLGLPVEFVFRRKYNDTSRGIVGYFWKAVPVRG